MKHELLGQVIAVANQKGGVGKTTTSINIAASLATLDKRVLLVDMDPQGNSSTGLGIEKSGVGKSVYNVLMGECSLQGAMINTVCEGLYLIPASMDLAGAEVELVSAEAREQRLSTAFNAYAGELFDYVFI
ncbi:MAG: ParA family protein, partial [Flavobacteriales bacterium]